jgi:integrase
MNKLSKRFPIRWRADRQVWEIDARPHGRIQSVRFPGTSGARVRLIERHWAEEIRATIMRDLARGVPEDAALGPYLPRHSKLDQTVTRWLNFMSARVAAGERSPTYLKRLRDFARPKGGQFAHLYHLSIYDIGYGQIEDWIAYLRDEHTPAQSATTIFHATSALRSCLRWHARRSNGQYTAPDFPHVERSDYEPKLFTMEQQEEVLAAIRVAKRGPFLALARLMLRPGEVRALNVGDYDPATRELRCEAAMKGLAAGTATRGRTKTRDRRLLVVPSDLAEWIEEFTPRDVCEFQPGAPLFSNPDAPPSTDRGRWSGFTLSHVWHEASLAAGLESIGLYNGTKHTTATWLRRSGVSLDEIALALGHAAGHRGAGGDKSITALYARPPRVQNATIIHALEQRRAERPERAEASAPPRAPRSVRRRQEGEG